MFGGGGNVQYYQDAGVVGPYDEDGTGAGGDDAGLSIVNNLLALLQKALQKKWRKLLK